MGWTTSPYLRAGALSCPSLAIYGPGLYGNEMACGGKLTKSTFGVAHKSLPCGTKVAIAHGGRIVIAPVVDRGPFVKGVEYDLTAHAAEAVRMSSTSEIRANR